MQYPNFLARLAVVVCLTSFSAEAAVVQFSAPLTTDQEVPAPDLTGGFTPSGSATAIVNTDAMTLVGTMSWSGLTTGAFMGHIHRRPIDAETGPVLVGFFEADPPLGLTDSITTPTINLSPDQLQSLIEGLLEGTLYFNLHTTRNRPGEIRGNITSFVVVPEPGTWTLLGGGLLAFAARRIRRP